MSTDQLLRLKKANNKINNLQPYEYFFGINGNNIFGKTVDSFTATDEDLFYCIGIVQFRTHLMKNLKKFFLKTLYFWNKIFCLLYLQYFNFWAKMFNKYFPTKLNLTKPKSVLKFVAWPFIALVKYLAWSVRVQIYNLPFQAIAFYFEYQTQSFYSVLYIPEIIASLFFISFPMSLRIVGSLVDDFYRGSDSRSNSEETNLETAFKSLTSLYNIQDTQKTMWLVPFLLVQEKLGPGGWQVVFAYLQMIFGIFVISIISWLPVIPFNVAFFSNNFSYGENSFE
jgi:hypothetical protein